jgi:peptide/nickel transport system permease protein
MDMTDEIKSEKPIDNAAGAPEEAAGITHAVKEISPSRMVMKRFFKSKLSVVGVALLLFLVLFSVLGPVVYRRWGETEVDTSVGRTVYNPPRAVQYTAEDGQIYTVYEESYTQYPINIYAEPGGDHLLGTDDKGLDIFVRLMYGGRISLTIGFIVIFLETLIGVLLGGIAGFFGKWVDQLIMRVIDIFNCLPGLPIMLIASLLLDTWEVPANTRIYYLMAIMTLFGWSGIARMVRGQILSLREQDYMVAAEAMGFSAGRRIRKHLIPNVMPQLIVSMTLGLGGVILAEAALSFLGLGVRIPYAAWGTMISITSDSYMLDNHFNMWGPPGILIVMAVLAFNFIGDGLRDAMDPRTKR